MRLSSLRKKGLIACGAWILAGSSLIIQDALADGRSLDQAANNAVNIATNLGRAISVLGILVAAIAYNIPGLSSTARRILTGSLAGAVCAFGGPALIKVIQSIF